VLDFTAFVSKRLFWYSTVPIVHQTIAYELWLILDVNGSYCIAHISLTLDSLLPILGVIEVLVFKFLKSYK